MRIAICDDVREMLTFLDDEIKKLLDERQIKYTLELFDNGIDFLAEHRKDPFDVVFLDIIMPDVNGFDAAKRLREINAKTYIIFVTTESSLVYDSLDFQPFHFIPKGSPGITKKRLSHVIKKLLIHFSANQKIVIPATYGEKYYAYPQEIIYVESDAKNVLYHFSGRPELRVRGNMNDTEEILGRYLFARIHSRYIVNLSYVRGTEHAGSEVKLAGGQTLPVSRMRKKSFLEAYNAYMRNF